MTKDQQLQGTVEMLLSPADQLANFLWQAKTANPRELRRMFQSDLSPYPASPTQRESRMISERVKNDNRGLPIGKYIYTLSFYPETRNRKSLVRLRTLDSKSLAYDRRSDNEARRILAEKIKGRAVLIREGEFDLDYFGITERSAQSLLPRSTNAMAMAIDQHFSDYRVDLKELD